MGELRESKKRETRERISDVATRLFLERGFDAVTVEDVAKEARVSTVTVFNYFKRKEDLFFDRGEENLALVREALAEREGGPLAALGSLVRSLVKEAHPLVAFDEGTMVFWRTTKESPALRARARALRAEFEHGLARLLAERAPRDALVPLVAGMLVAAWCVAFTSALERRRAGATPAAARNELLRQVERALGVVRDGIRGDRGSKLL